MRLYVHLQGSGDEVSVVLTVGEGEFTVQTLKQKFIDAVLKKHQLELKIDSLSLQNERGKTINTDAELKKLISDKDNVFVTQRDAAPPPTPSTPVQAKPELKGPTATKPEPKASKQADPDSDSDDETPTAFGGRDVWQVAQELIGANNFEELDTQMTMGLFEEQTNAHIYYFRAVARWNLKLYLIAIDDLNRCLILEPRHQKGLLLKIRCLMKIRDFSAARALCRALRLLVASPNAGSPGTSSQPQWFLDAAENELVSQIANESEYKLIQKRKEIDPSFKSLEGALTAPVLVHSLAVIQGLIEKQLYDQARPALLEILDYEPMQRETLVFLAEIFSKAARPAFSIEYLMRATLFHPTDAGIRERLAQELDASKNFAISASLWASLIKLPANNSIFPAASRSKDLLAKLALALRAVGEIEAAWNLIVTILKQDDEHVPALLGYALVMKDREMFDESCKVALRLLVKDSKSDTARELLADSIRHKRGYDFLISQLLQVPRPATGIGFVALTVRDWGAVEEAAELYAECVKAEPASASFCLNLVHGLEVLNRYDEAFTVLKSFLQRNPYKGVGPLLCAHVFNAISGVDSLTAHRNWLPPKALVDESRNLTIDAKRIPAPLPQDKMYDDESLDLLALLCTLVKMCYATGALALIPPLVSLIEPVREGRPMHKTTIRNEHAYYCCISLLMKTLQLPIKNKNTIYVAGDSHSMTPAWRTVQVGTNDFTLEPLLVTGLKCWHLREESKFYPKMNFYNVVPCAPAGSKIVMMFGEIDCREGFLISVQKCRYESLEEAALTTINIYIDILLKLQEEKHYQLFIHPVLPVIDVTRPIVTKYNELLKQRVLETPSLKWLDFFEDLLTPDAKLKPEYELDGTHMHPSYLPLLQRELEKVMSQ